MYHSKENYPRWILWLCFLFQGGLSSAVGVRVKVMDINDNRPTFYPVLYTVSLSTHSAPGTSVVKVTANDPDAGENGRITYRTVPGGSSPFFTLNKDTGEPLTFTLYKGQRKTAQFWRSTF